MEKSASCNFIIRENLAQVFSCEYCDFLKINYFVEHMQRASSEKITSNN